MTERGGGILAVICAGMMLGSCGPKPPERQSDGYATLECATCTIGLSPIATLTSAADSVQFDAFATVATGPHGEFLVAPVGNGAQIARYARDGMFVGTVGRAGRGPGEFQRIRHVTLARADSVLVLDNRLTLLSPSFHYVRSGAPPSGIAPGDGVVLRDGSVVLNGQGPGTPLFVLFSPALHDPRPLDVALKIETGADRGFVMTRDGSGGFWAAREAYHYELLHFDSTGTLIDSLTPPALWYEDWSYNPATPEDPTSVPPHARIGGIWRDAAGRLWVVGASADRNWKPLVRQGHAAQASIPPLSTWRTLFDSHVDVIDPKTGAVLASRAYDGILEGFTGDGLLWEAQQDSAGVITLRMIRAELRALARALPTHGTRGGTLTSE